MTLPNGPDGINPAAEYGITANNGSISGLPARTQDAITEQLKASKGPQSPWGNPAGPLAQAVAGLPTGMPVALAILTVVGRGLLQQADKVWDSVEDLLIDLQPFVDDIAGLGDLVEAVTGVEDGDLNDLGTFFLNVRTFLTGIDFTDPDFDFDEAASAFVTTVVQPLIQAVESLRKLSIGWLTDEPQNMIEPSEAGFDGPATIVEGSGFVHDDTDGVPGSSPVGCAKLVCDGADHQQITKLYPVGGGWEVKAGSRVKWESITAGANAIRVDVQPYFVENNVATPVGSAIMVASVASPTGSSGGTGGWGSGPIEGTYNVPTDGTVNFVAAICHVTSSATAGTVKYDNAFVIPMQDIPQEWIRDLLNDLQGLLDWISHLVENALTALGITPTGSLLDKIADLSDALDAIKTKADTALDDLADLVSDLLTNPGAVLGTIGQDLIENLEDDLAEAGDAIGDVYDDVRDGWNKLWDGVFGSTGSTGKTADDVKSAAEVVAATATGAAGAAQTAVNLFNLGINQPMWGATNPTMETTLVESSLTRPIITVANSANMSCPDASHTHNAGTVSSTQTAISIDGDPWNFAVTSTASAMGFIRCAKTQDKSVFQWIGKGNSVTTCKLHIYRMDAAGDVTHVHSEDVDPLELPAGEFDLVTVALSDPIHVEPGDVLTGEICVTGGTHYVAGLTVPWRGVDDSARPKRPGATRNSGSESSPPSTIADGSVPYNSSVPYMGIGMLLSELPPPKYSYFDTFDNLTNWTTLAGSYTVGDGNLLCNTNNPSAIVYNNALASDKIRAQFLITAKRPGVFPGWSDGARTRYGICCNAAMTQGVFIEIESNNATSSTHDSDVRIVTCTAPTGGTRTVRASGATVIGSGLNAGGGIGPMTAYGWIEYTPADNTYRVWLHDLDSTPDLTWVDSGNVISHGAGFRQSGIFTDWAGSGTPSADLQIVCAQMYVKDLD